MFQLKVYLSNEIDLFGIKTLVLLNSIQQKKFNKLLIENRPKQDPDEVIFNISKLQLTDAEKTLLVKSLSCHLSSLVIQII